MVTLAGMTHVLSPNKDTAIKVEPANSTKQVLKMEVAVLKRLQGIQNFCDLLGYGRTEKVNYIVMNMLGPNLSELRKHQPHQVFSISTTLRLGIQILDALQALHNCGFLHRDLKPSNIAIGLTSESCRNCFMIDFGLARQYITPTGEIREPRPTAGFRGTVRYASLNAHLARDLGRNDDLWSLFYMLVELHTGELPWRKVKDKDEVGKLKAECDHTKLIKGLPSEFNLFLKYVETLTYFDKPEYCYLTTLFKRAMQKFGIHDSDPFDWEQDTSAPSVTTASVGSPPAFRSHGKGSPEMIVVNNQENKGKGETKTDCSDVRELSKNVSEKKITINVEHKQSPNHSIQEHLPVETNKSVLSPKVGVLTSMETRAHKNSDFLCPPKFLHAVGDENNTVQANPVCQHSISIMNESYSLPPVKVPRPPQISPPSDYTCISARRRRFVRAREDKT